MSHRISLRRASSASVVCSSGRPLSSVLLAMSAAALTACSGVATPDIFADGGFVPGTDGASSTFPTSSDASAPSSPGATEADAAVNPPAEVDASGAGTADAANDATTEPPHDAAAVDATTRDASGGDGAGADVSATDADAGTITCGTARCAAATQVCCVSPDMVTNAPAARCVTGAMCPAGTIASLSCANDDDCTGTDLCCLTTSTAIATSQCRAQCNNGTRELCQANGSARQCSGGQRCVMGLGGNLGRALPNVDTCQ